MPMTADRALRSLGSDGAEGDPGPRRIKSLALVASDDLSSFCSIGSFYVSDAPAHGPASGAMHLI